MIGRTIGRVCSFVDRRSQGRQECGQRKEALEICFCPVRSMQKFLYYAIGILFCTAEATLAVAVATGRFGSKTNRWYGWTELGFDVSQKAGSSLRPRERSS